MEASTEGLCQVGRGVLRFPLRSFEVVTKSQKLIDLGHDAFLLCEWWYRHSEATKVSG